MDMALRMGGYVDRLLSLSQDAVFQTRLKKQLKVMRILISRASNRTLENQEASLRFSSAHSRTI